jgi:hypothetical protein
MREMRDRLILILSHIYQQSLETCRTLYNYGKVKKQQQQNTINEFLSPNHEWLAFHQDLLITDIKYYFVPTNQKLAQPQFSSLHSRLSTYRRSSSVIR